MARNRYELLMELKSMSSKIDPEKQEGEKGRRQKQKNKPKDKISKANFKIIISV